VQEQHSHDDIGFHYDKVWGDMGRYGEVWGGMGRYGRYGVVWGDMGRYGEVWGDVGRYGFHYDKAEDHASNISPHLPTSPHISSHLPTSPHISPHLPTSPHISLQDEAYASNQMTMLFPEVRAGLGVGSGSSPRSGLGLG